MKVLQKEETRVMKHDIQELLTLMQIPDIAAVIFRELEIMKELKKSEIKKLLSTIESPINFDPKGNIIHMNRDRYCITDDEGLKEYFNAVLNTPWLKAVVLQEYFSIIKPVLSLPQNDEDAISG